MDKIKYSIIGCGIVGLAVAAGLSGPEGGDIVVFEKHSKADRNKQQEQRVIHAGLYYPKGSLKSELCIKGNNMLYEYCEKNSVGFKNCGKLMVSTDQKDREKIAEIIRTLYHAASKYKTS